MAQRQPVTVTLTELPDTENDDAARWKADFGGERGILVECRDPNCSKPERGIHVKSVNLYALEDLENWITGDIRIAHAGCTDAVWQNR